MNHNPKNTTLSPADREKMLSKIVALVRKHHVNIAGIDYAVWEASFDRTGLSSRSVAEFESDVRDWMNGLKSSHVAFFHGQYNRFLPQHTINATVEPGLHMARERWRILDVFPEGPADRAGLQEDDVLISANGVELQPPDLPVLGTGQTHRLEIWDEKRKDHRNVEVEVPFKKGTSDRPPIVEPKAITASIQDRNKGVLKIPYFSGSIGIKFMKELAQEIERFNRAGVTRLEIDLRGNIGGSLGFAGLASYLCPDERPIGFSLTPKALANGFEKEKLPRVPMPRSRLGLAVTMSKFLTKDKSVVLMTQNLGPQPFHGRVEVRVNQWTNSAGEMLASFAQENGLATITGVKTAGNVLGARNFSVGQGYWVRFPVFGWMTWSGKCLEGCGVMPDRMKAA